MQSKENNILLDNWAIGLTNHHTMASTVENAMMNHTDSVLSVDGPSWRIVE